MQMQLNRPPPNVWDFPAIWSHAWVLSANEGGQHYHPLHYFLLLGHYPGIDSDNNGDINTEDARDDNTDTNKDDSGEDNKHAELLNTCQLYPHYIWQLRAEYLVIYLL